MSVSLTVNETTRAVSVTVSNERGPAGATGETGPAGPTGATGATGATGPAGSDATVTAANTLTALEAMTVTQDQDAREALGYSRPASAGSLPAPASLTFSRVKVERKMNPIPSEFVFFDTKFENSSEITVELGAAITPGTGLVLTKNGGAQAFATAKASKILGPCVAIEVSANFAAASGATQYVGCGITLRSATTSTNYITAYWDKVAGTVGLDIKKAGVQTTIAGSAFAPTAAFKMLVLIYGNTVAMLADTTNGWTLIHTWRNSLATPWNLRTDWDSNDFVPMAMAHATSGSWTITRFRAGYAGYVGLQSLCYVKDETGAPLIDEAGNYYMNATASLPFDSPGTATNWNHCHGMVFKVDPTTYEMTPTAQLFPYRAGEWRMDDAFGPIIYDRSERRWNYLTQNASQLGSVNAAILNYYSDGNLIQGCHVLTDFHEVVMPGTKPRWDADAIKVGSTWYVAHASRTANLLAGTFFPALASGTSLSGAFTEVGSDATQTASEGLHFAKIGGTYYVCSSTSGGMLIYDMTMTLVTTITPTGYVVGSVPHPHCNLVPLPIGSRTRYIIETFNRTLGMGAGVATYGDREIYEASQLYDGNEFAVDSVIQRR